MYRSESSSPSRVTLALGLPSDRHRLLGGTVACVLFGEVVHQVGTSGLAQSLVPHPGPGPKRLSRESWARVSSGHGFILLMSTPTQGCSSIPSSRPGQPSQPHQPSQSQPGPGPQRFSRASWARGVRRSGDLGQHRELRPCTSRANATRRPDVERPSSFYTPGFSTSFLHITPSQSPVQGV